MGEGKILTSPPSPPPSLEGEEAGMTGWLDSYQAPCPPVSGLRIECIQEDTSSGQGGWALKLLPFFRRMICSK